MKYRSLELWRGIAALWVCLFHALLPLADRTAPAGFGWLQQIAGQGAFGVQLFFVISGYCIGVRASQECRPGSACSGGGFMIDRLIRIVPVYHAAWIFAVLLGVVLMPVSHGLWIASASAPGVLPGSLAATVQSLTLTELFAGKFPIVRVSWTLTAELSYYVLVALGLELVRSTRQTRPAIVLACALAAATAFLPMANPTSFANSAIAGWRHFMCGFLVSVILAQPSFRTRASQAALATVVFLGVLGWWAHHGYWRGWVPALFALLLVVLYRFDTVLADHPALRWLNRCGAISYSLYLIHDPVVSRASRFLLQRPALPPTAVFFCALAGVLAAVAVASLFYRVVEQPIETWRKRRRARVKAETAVLSFT